MLFSWQTDIFAKAEIGEIDEQNFSHLHPKALVDAKYGKTTKFRQVLTSLNL